MRLLVDVKATIDVLDEVPARLAHAMSDRQAEFFNNFFAELYTACKRSGFSTQTQLLHIWDGLDDDARKNLEFIACRH